MSMMRTDIAVIGAGPAGSIAAQRLAAAGAQVILIEKDSFPRDKSCGDGVTSEGLDILAAIGLASWAAQFPEMAALRLTSPDGQVLDIDFNQNDWSCVGRIIPRYQLDEQLARHAAESGAVLLEDAQVTAVEQHDNQTIRITAGKQVIESRLLILADGSHAPVTRRLGLIRTKPELSAMRQYFTGDTEAGGPLEIHYTPSILPGYTWLFPVGDGRVNIGTGSYSRRIAQGKINLHTELDRFLTHHPVTADRLKLLKPAGPLKGHPLRTNLNETRTHADGILVAGDAAGLVNPFTGVGIGQAMGGGELAARHALQALQNGNFMAENLAPYTRDLQARYGSDQKAARTLRDWLSPTPVLNWLFRRLRQNEPLALLLGHIIFGKRSPRLALHPKTWLQLFQ